LLGLQIIFELKQDPYLIEIVILIISIIYFNIFVIKQVCSLD